jgi:ferritin-like metal-binding protein YciE
VNGQLATLVSLERAHLSNTQEAAMSGTIQKASDNFIVGPRNQYAVESQAIELLERQVGRLENCPEMVDRMRHHIDESQE